MRHDMSDAIEANGYLFGSNTVFVEELYQRYQQDPSSVDASWREFFTALGEDAHVFYPSWAPKTHKVIGVADASAAKPAGDKGGKASAAPVIDARAIQDSISAQRIIHAYRVRGHLLANLDPLHQEVTKYHPELDAKTYGFSDDDMDRKIELNGTLGLEKATMREILSVLKQTYCSTFAVEFMHIQFPEQKQWIQERIENARGKPVLSAEEKHEILDNLIEVEAFEEFLQVKTPGVKRFSVQGGDAAIAGIQAAIATAAQHRVKEIVIGMPHRGRLNVLTTVMGKPYAEMFSLFHGNLDFPEWVGTSGDVKYHIGASSDREFANGHKMHLSLNANPSHLEVVNPVVCGKVRAKMDQYKDDTKTQVMGIQLHGDAAFAGQGSVAETLSLSELRGYRTGGSLHVIVNNQIGFTTSPKYSRFTPYPSDVAKMVQAPIFHVNGEDPEAVVFACKLAVDFRQAFQRDVVVDVICYRKYGHNESDEPMFTQPLMYKKIKDKKSPAFIYAQQLIQEGVVRESDVEQEFAEFKQFFNEQYDLARDFKPNNADWLEGRWSGFERPKNVDREEPKTGVDVKELKSLGMALAKEPTNFHVNSKIVRLLKVKEQMMDTGKELDWAMGEALAFATLLKEGHHVRLSGQDCGRGTFSHRHSVLVDQDNESRYVPLNNLGGEQATYEVIDSSLSELAVLGFEYGYSLAEPNALTLWEGQFGDFSNGAQMIIDQFICSGEVKWLRMSGLVMLLPHGYEGQGPEHSSARIERYLQLCAEDNMQAVNCTTPANYFHALRRQLHTDFRKPLVVFTPKSLLRHKLCVSTLADMAEGTSFNKIYPEHEKLVADSKISRVILTSGKVYYELLAEREEKKITDVAIIRIEQYYPFPERDLTKELKRYPNAVIFWCQEEPENMGAWRFIKPCIEQVMENLDRDGEKIRYAGRVAAASPAAGYMKLHNREQKELIATAFALIEVRKRKAS
jgi:2-oxoglutarate dehydrogenase E1 component